MTASNSPIGILDSGFGGLNVLREAMALLPRERFVYYGDFAHAPYGSKSATQVAGYVASACDALLERGAKALVLACNTATSAAVANLRARLTVPVIGMEPALKPAAAAHPGGRLLVMATELTLRERKFQDLMARVAGGCVVDPLPCPGLAGAVDTGDLDAAMRRARELLNAHPAARQAAAVVLGCSHYAFAARAIREWFGGAIALYEGSRGTARRLAAALEEQGLRAPNPAGDPETVDSDLARVGFVLPGAAGDATKTAMRLLRNLDDNPGRTSA